MTLETTPAKPTSTVEESQSLVAITRLGWGRDGDVLVWRGRD